MNFRFGFDVAVFRGAHKNAHPGAIDAFDIDACIVKRFTGAINSDAARASAPANVLSALVTGGFEIALAGNRLAKVANFVRRNAALARQKSIAEIRQGVAVGGCEAVGDVAAADLRPGGNRVVRRVCAALATIGSRRIDPIVHPWMVRSSDAAWEAAVSYTHLTLPTSDLV